MNEIKITLLLADSAQAVNGKLYILGGGWSITGPEPHPMAVAIKIEVPWDQANEEHRFRLVLIDADGNEILVKDEQGIDNIIEVNGEFETGCPPGLIKGTPLDVVLAINIGPIPLNPGERYAWKLYINDETHNEWSLGFSTRNEMS